MNIIHKLQLLDAACKTLADMDDHFDPQRKMNQTEGTAAMWRMEAYQLRLRLEALRGVIADND